MITRQPSSAFSVSKWMQHPAATAGQSRAAQAEMILAYTNRAALAFWNAYLKDDAQAKEYLHSDALPQFSNGAVKLYRR